MCYECGQQNKQKKLYQDFCAAGGALLASTSIAGQTMDVLRGQKNDKKSDNDGLLKGVCDIHLLVRQNPARLIGLN